jgi:amino acid transporter
MEQTSPTGLIRGIRRWDLVAAVINGIIGAGIFGLPSKVYALVGAYSIAAFVVCAVVVSLIVLCFAEVGSRFAETGGPYLYATEAFGPFVGFEVGWLMWLTRLTGFAANCNLLVSYLNYFWPAVEASGLRAGVIAAVVAGLTIVNFIGVRETAIAGDVFTVGKLAPLIFFIVAGLAFLNPQNFSFGAPPSYESFSTAVLLSVYAFTGFEIAIIPAGEVSNPRRNQPFALLLALGVVALVYFFVQIVCVGTLPELAASDKPLADAAHRFLGAIGAAIISAGAIVSIIGNLNNSLLAGSRLPFAMAEQRQLPPLLSKTHRRFRTPHFAIMLTSAVVLGLTLSGTFIYALTVSTIARLLAYSTTCTALLVLRRKAGAAPAWFNAPAGALVAIASLLLIVWLLSNSTWREARDVGIAAALGLLVYLLCRGRTTGQ